MGILENGLMYALDIVKLYLVFRYFLGVELKNEKWRYGCVLFLLVGFALFLEYYKGNPIFGYLIFITAEIYILFKEKIGKLIVSSLWMASVIGVLDGMGKITVWMILKTLGKESILITMIDSCITILFILIMIVMLRRKSEEEKIKIHLGYYIFFSLLGLADSLMISSMWYAFESMNGDSLFYFPVFIGVICMYIQMGMVLALAVSRDGYKEKDMLNRKYLKIQEEQYDYLQKKEADIRTFRHDMNDHILILKELCEEENYDKLKNYVKEITNQMHIDDNKAATGDGIVDAIVNRYLFMAEQEGVELKIRGKLLEKNEIESFDCCVIFSNLLRNAVEAAKESEKKRAELLIRDIEKELLIQVKNDYKGKRKVENGRYVTTKEDKISHGIGLSNVQKSVDKYHGLMETAEENEVFIVRISIKKQK